MNSQANEPAPSEEQPVNEADEPLEQNSAPMEDDPREDASAASETNNATFWTKLSAFLHTYDFPILILIAIGLAAAYPPLGAEYLAPEITAKVVAVCIIFFFSGLGVCTSHFCRVIMEHLKFNVFLQVFNFMVVSAVVFGVTHLHSLTGILDQELVDGLIICSTLPMSINVGIILTTSAGGDVAAAVLHSAGGNAIGIFLSPLLILMYRPDFVADVDLVEVILSLVLRVLVPLLVGQLVQRTMKGVYEFYLKHRPIFKKIPELLLVYIVYTIFCKSFAGDTQKAGWKRIIVLIVTELLFQAVLSAVAWYCLKYLIPNEPGLRVCGTICSSHKTIALGAPLIGSIVEGRGLANEGFYFLPLLMWHPMQLVFGSMFVSTFKHWIASEEKRLAAPNESAVSTPDVESVPGEDDTIEAKPHAS